MDEISAREGRERMMELLEKYENDPSFGQRQKNRVCTENKELYDYLCKLSSNATLFLGNQGEFFLAELSMAYHIIEATNSRAIPLVEKRTIDELVEKMATGKIDPNKELERLLKNNAVYGGYVQGTWSHWKQLYPHNEVIASYLARHLIFLESLAEMQRIKDIARNN